MLSALLVICNFFNTNQLGRKDGSPGSESIKKTVVSSGLKIYCKNALMSDSELKIGPSIAIVHKECRNYEFCLCVKAFKFIKLFVLKLTLIFVWNRPLEGLELRVQCLLCMTR